MIDAHVHVWVLDPDRYPWHQTLASVPIPSEPAPVEDLLARMDRAGVGKALLVQPSIYGWDNSYVCESAERYPDRLAVVCLVDPRSPDAARDLRYWCRERGCCGVRINTIGDSQPADWLAGPGSSGFWDAVEDLAIPVSVQMRPDQAPALTRLARHRRAIRFVADYLGPEAVHDGSGVTALRKLGNEPNIYCKLLVVGQDSTSPYPFADLWPFYKAALDAFGPQRVAFGTDYPHVMSACAYELAARLLNELPFIGGKEQQLVSEGTAEHLWKFDRSYANEP